MLMQQRAVNMYRLTPPLERPMQLEPHIKTAKLAYPPMMDNSPPLGCDYPYGDAGNIASKPIARPLNLEDVITILNSYSTFDMQNIVCCICGKHYKSRVCFTKHLWEHSVYWDCFAGGKNQDRVLAIQAAIILSRPRLSFLLVTYPQEKKKESTLAVDRLHRHRKRKYSKDG
eukprot:m.35620 g.35620  ORF g.35620 m.35620 type:complete len:172 (+) comp32148_c0_seq1:14-529(+)